MEFEKYYSRTEPQIKGKNQMKELTELLVTKLVDKPKEVRIEEKEEEGTIKLKVHVAPEDIGKIVGKKGQNISALRTILKAIAAKEKKKRVVVDLDEY